MDIKRELSENYGFSCTINSNVSRSDLLSKLDELKHKTFNKYDQLLISFSGHGEYDEDRRRGFFVFGNGEKMEFRQIANIISNIPCDHILVLFDACYSGSIYERIPYDKGKARRPGESDDSKLYRIVLKQFQNKSRLYITSGGVERTSDGVNNSPFTEHFLHTLHRTRYTGDGIATYFDMIGGLSRLSPSPNFGKFQGHQGGGFVFVSAVKSHLKQIDINRNNRFNLFKSIDNILFAGSESFDFEITYEAFYESMGPFYYKTYLNRNGKYEASSSSLLGESLHTYTNEYGYFRHNSPFTRGDEWLISNELPANTFTDFLQFGFFTNFTLIHHENCIFKLRKAGTSDVPDYFDYSGKVNVATLFFKNTDLGKLYYEGSKIIGFVLNEDLVKNNSRIDYSSMEVEVKEWFTVGQYNFPKRFHQGWNSYEISSIKINPTIPTKIR